MTITARLVLVFLVGFLETTLLVESLPPPDASGVPLSSSSSSSSSLDTESPPPTLTAPTVVNPSVVETLVENVESVAEQMVDNMEQFAESAGRFLVDEVQKTMLAGNVWSVVERFTKAPWNEILQNVLKVLDWKDIVFLVALGWATVPAVQYPYQHRRRHRQQLQQQYNNNNNNNYKMPDNKAFRDTVSFQVANHVSQIAKIALLVYAVDLLKIMAMGFSDWKYLKGMSHTFAKVAYTLWFARRCSLWKRHVIHRVLMGRGSLSAPGGTTITTAKMTADHQSMLMGRQQILDRLGDAVLLALVGVAVVDILSVDLGITGVSVVALGGTLTLIVSLAAQDMAKQVMSGLLLSASDQIYEGDVVVFNNDGLRGTIVKMGWVETVLRGSDEIHMSVPNTDLSNQRLSNLSRLRKCQVTQTLRFDYEKVVEKLPQLCDDIKQEIRQACPSLIHDGSRPFRVVWTDYQNNCIVVKVDAHFNIRPIGEDYWDNRERVLDAIHRAIKNNGVELR